MDSTAAFAPDSAFHPEDVPPTSAPPQAQHGEDIVHTASQWLSQAMALWLQDPDAPSDAAPVKATALASSRASH